MVFSAFPSGIDQSEVLPVAIVDDSGVIRRKRLKATTPQTDDENAAFCESAPRLHHPRRLP
jgi:hypothetical protein